MAWSEHDYTDAAAMAAALAGLFAGIARAAIAARGSAVFALAGGGTPLPLYARWAEQDLDWTKVRIVPTDERCVAHAHPACNARALAGAFAAAGDGIVLPLTPADGDADRAQAYARGVLAGFPQPFDAVLLGMGNDAHTASLFPGAAALVEALAPDAADAWRIDPQPLPPEAPFPRVTLSAARLLRSRQVHLMITGEGKRAVLRDAQARSDPLSKPVCAVLNAAPASVHIHWSQP